MARQDVHAVRALRRELRDRLKERAMAAVWSNLMGLSHLMKVHRDEFNIGGAEEFLRHRLTAVQDIRSSLEETYRALGQPDPGTIVYQSVQSAWSSEDGHLPNRVRFVRNYLDTQVDKSYKALLAALLELSETLDLMLLHFARIREGSAANITPILSEDTGPPEPSRIRLRRRGRISLNQSSATT
jgi:hypothetical protein